jgi:hypothetical protein
MTPATDQATRLRPEQSQQMPKLQRSSSAATLPSVSAIACASTILLSNHARFGQTARSALVTAHDSWSSIRASPAVSRSERDRRHKNRSSAHRPLSALQQHLSGPKHSSSLSKTRAPAKEKEAIHTKRTIQRPSTLRRPVIGSSSLTKRTSAAHSQTQNAQAAKQKRKIQ